MCNQTFQIKKSSNRKHPLPWWNEKIQQLKRECSSIRRQIMRSKDKRSRNSLSNQLTTLRRSLRYEIKLSKKQLWGSWIEELEKDIWGRAYKVRKRRLKTPPNHDSASLSDQEIISAVNQLFPTHDKCDWPLFVQEDIQDITMDELIRAVSKIKNRKAFGPDNISPELAKMFVRANAKDCLQMYNNYLKRGVFPTEWKTARLALIPKIKPGSKEKAFRPICMLNVLGKIFEQIIVARLLPEIDLSPNQHGFRKAHSTTDAINEVRKEILENLKKDYRHRPCLALLTLDIRNAFNSLSWQDVHESLLEKNVPSYIIRIILSYLSNRFVTANGLTFMINSGVPQGSVLGPHLWCICYDKIVNLVTETAAKKIAYADDLALLVEGKNRSELSRNTNSVTKEINTELNRVKLSLEPSKTEAEVITSKKKSRRNYKVKVVDHPVTPVPAIKYLGLWLDNDGRLNTHFKKIAEKTASVIKGFSCILPNVRGPSFMKRKLIVSAILSIIFYAVNIWASAPVSNKNKKLLTKTIRPLKIRLCMAYRTTSNSALDLISGIPPIGHLIEERLRLRKREEDKPTIKASIRSVWIDDWMRDQNSDVWLKQLIPDPERWLTRNHGDLNFFLTQVLTGHGAFNSYLNRFKISTSDVCPHCPSAIDTPEHTIFKCAHYTPQRSRLEACTGQILTVDNFEDLILSSESNWCSVCSYIKLLLDDKKLALDSLIQPDECLTAVSGLALPAE